MTVDEVCTELRISRRTGERWRASGLGPRSAQLGDHGPVRIRREWLDKWIDACTRAA
ncbi:helix-turn-helix domain-containing protein [Streptosporangium sp. LJ11]|uniref:helix-turn-helix transcriptional regulator n=1 Tax=Streptosporangium sp. LJ11 TaxID=3436927 RepID=UPI003F7AFE78